MSKPGPKYDSQRDRENYTFHPGRQFHLEFNSEPGACYLFALDERQASLLRTMLAVFPKYYWVWGLPGPMSDWDAGIEQQWTDISDFVEELEACLLSGCDVSQLITQVTRIADNIEALSDRFTTHNWIAEDTDIADILANSLFGNYIDPIPNPLEGDGLADILDDQADLANTNLDILHNRLRMADSSLFNPLADEKNITEALETLLRRDKLSDLEFLFPNIATILENTFNTGDQGIVVALKNLLSRLAPHLNVPDDWLVWLQDKLETEERLSAGDILLLIAHGISVDDGSKLIAKSIQETQTIVNLNNTMGCDCDVEDCDCGEGQTIVVSENGTGG